MTVAIIYGFSEGLWQTKRFRKILSEQGFKVIDDPESADIIITHSGGAFTVPPLRSSQVLMLINPPYWPGRSLGARGRATTLQLLRAIRPGNRPWYHCNKTAHNIWYLCVHLRTNITMTRLARSYDLAEQVQHPKTLLIRTFHDPWLTPNLAAVQKAHPQLHLCELPGEHDDCWLNPEPYINLLQSFCKE